MPCDNCDDCTLKCSMGTQWISCKRCGLRFFDKGEIPSHICIVYDEDNWE